ncbi:MAG TPA: DM13 domain-containing protein [Acidimicrobiales bacterium]|nr:DM13 domain-containing protein [Acidimicrobiales bacterium]
MRPTLDPIDIPPPHPRSRAGWRRLFRRGVVIPAGIVLLGLVVFVLVWFQPQKLFIDDKVDETAPVGATPLSVTSPATSAPAPSTSGAPAVSAGADDPATTSAPSTVSPTTVPAPPPPPAPAQFISLDHGTTGNLLVLQDAQGTRYVRFEAFATENGPDLFVYLSTNPIDGPEQAFDDDFVNLGRLQGNLGDQNYAVPADADLSRYRSVVVWCDRFNSAFGAAPLI